MTGTECNKLYHNKELKAYLWKAIKRYTSCPETAEDYFQEAWLKIWKKAEGGQSIAYYCEIARKAVHAVWKKQYRDGSVDKKSGSNVHGYSEGVKE